MPKVQRGQKSRQTTAQRELRKVEAAIERITDAVAEMGVFRTQREKLSTLEASRDELEAQLHITQPDANAAAPLPRAMDRWRRLVTR